MKPKRLIQILSFASLFLLFSVSHAQNYGVTAVQDIDNIVPERERAKIMNEWLEWRLEHILPSIMRREGIDMWLVICREYNEDPVYMTLVPEPHMSARRTSILIFYDPGEGRRIERLTGSFYDMGKWYTSIYKDKKKDQFDTLAEFIREKDPRTIGINVSDTWSFGDGLTASFKEKLEGVLGNSYASRLVSAENLTVGWLETRSPQELSVYRYICGIAHDIIAEFFSNKVIIPDVTTTDDVVWWIRQKFTDLGLKTWFQPSIDIQRSKKDSIRYSDAMTIIRRGDLLHCDIGITYLGLNTDTQQMAYVYRKDEIDVPEGLKVALQKANMLQDIFMGEFRKGRTGNEILLTSLRKAKDEGLKPSIYTHPIGYHGHAAGPVIGLWDRQDGVPVSGDYPLYYNTCHSIELNNKYNVPEWDNQEVRIPLEEDAAFTEDGSNFLDGRQTAYYVIK